MTNGNRKVARGGLAGAVTTVLVYLASQFEVTIPGEVAAAITTIIAALVGWLTPDYARQPQGG